MADEVHTEINNFFVNKEKPILQHSRIGYVYSRDLIDECDRVPNLAKRVSHLLDFKIRIIY